MIYEAHLSCLYRAAPAVHMRWENVDGKTTVKSSRQQCDVWMGSVARVFLRSLSFQFERRAGRFRLQRDISYFHLD